MNTREFFHRKPKPANALTRVIVSKSNGKIKIKKSRNDTPIFTIFGVCPLCNH